jgi:hypothetical protein
MPDSIPTREANSGATASLSGRAPYGLVGYGPRTWLGLLQVGVAVSGKAFD